MDLIIYVDFDSFFHHHRYVSTFFECLPIFPFTSTPHTHHHSDPLDIIMPGINIKQTMYKREKYT